MSQFGMVGRIPPPEFVHSKTEPKVMYGMFRVLKRVTNILP